MFRYRKSTVAYKQFSILLCPFVVSYDNMFMYQSFKSWSELPYMPKGTQDEIRILVEIFMWQVIFCPFTPELSYLSWILFIDTSR